MIIKGKIVKLRPAKISERKNIYLWLAKSDLTSSMMGPPLFSEQQIPSYEEFCIVYNPDFFNASGDGKGRVYIIIVNNRKVGTIGYDLLDQKKNKVVLDIWMRAEKYCGSGYGSDSINALCSYIHKAFNITRFIISPSERNNRAIATYEKCGFRIKKVISKEEQLQEFGVSEYDDNVLMEKIM